LDFLKRAKAFAGKGGILHWYLAKKGGIFFRFFCLRNPASDCFVYLNFAIFGISLGLFAERPSQKAGPLTVQITFPKRK
jgi:hypothetical protein